MGLESALAGIVGASHVLVDPALTAGYETDWTGRYGGRARAVVRPRDVDEVSAVLRACAAEGVPVVPQGGNTGLVGGSVPRDGEVVVSTRRLDRLGPVDRAAGQVTAGAGVPLSALQRHARDAGLAYGVDLAARDTATVGGTVATNAGGIRVLAFGTTRAQVAGVEAVLASGEVMEHLGGLVKDATGYDLAGLLTGSEGTLAVVTAVRLRLVRPPRDVVTALVGLTGVPAAVELLARLVVSARRLLAAELMLADGVALVRSVTGLPAPFDRSWPAYLLVETEGTDGLAEVLADHAGDVAVGTDAVGRARLWAYRERHTEAVAAVCAADGLGPPHKLDVSVPAGRLAEVLDRLPDLVATADRAARVVVWGHAGDGNLHVNVLGPGPGDLRCDDAVLRLAAAAGGSISGEHGIGTAKVDWLPLSRTPAEIAAMRAVKSALDPDWLLNPGVLLSRPSGR